MKPVARNFVRWAVVGPSTCIWTHFPEGESGPEVESRITYAPFIMDVLETAFIKTSRVVWSVCRAMHTGTPQ
jgi:hypothetical protein